MNFFGIPFVVAVASLAAIVVARAQNASKAIDDARAKGYSVTSVTPIFSQLMKLSYPAGFAPAFENTKADFYIQESVPKGESVNNWTQMLTLTGRKELAGRPGATAKGALAAMAAGFQRACPESYSARSLSDANLGGFEAAVAVVSCGLSPSTAGKTSESALITVIKGQADIYTVQWAERAAASSTPIQIDLRKWQDRFKALNPIKLCPIVPGEKAPYRSCVGGEKVPT